MHSVARDRAGGVREFHDLSGSAGLSRALVPLLGVGSALILAASLLPHDGYRYASALPVIAAAGFATACLIAALGVRTPGWAAQVVLAAASLLLSAATAAAGAESYLPVSALFFWVALCASYYLSAPLAVTHLTLAGAGYGAALLFLSGEGTTPGVEAAVPGLLLASGALVGRQGRDRMQRLRLTLEHAARMDPVTGLLNRRGFEADLWKELERSYRNGRAFAVVLVDVDGLAHVNTRLGHAAGDSAVNDIASALERNRRDVDSAARLSGGEFALLLPETDERGGFSVAERLRMDIRERFGRGAVNLTVSAGIAVYPDNGRTPEGLFTCAEQARALAKELGRDRCVIFNPRVTTALSAATAKGDGERERQLATIVALAEALDMRDSGTAAHSQAVARYASSIARELGLAPEVVERVRYGGLVHDVGKIAVPDAILSKPGPLTDEEWRQMRRHPEIGAQLLDGAGVRDIQNWVMAHHERYDGGGYPFGIAGDAVPLEAKILAVADAYEAMTADRPYRDGMRMEDACLELVEGAGSQFDPRVVDAFIRLLVRSDPTVMSTVWERTNGAGRARLAASERRAACQPGEVPVQA